MNSYDARQINRSSRRWNGIRACQVVEIDNERGIIFKLPWGDGTSWIKPSNFEVEPYKVGDWIDMILKTVSSEGRIYLQSEQYIGKTPEAFIPEK